MADDEPAKRSKRWVWFVALPIFYVLSIGPVIMWLEWLEEHSSPRTFQVAANTAEVVYAPLLWTEESMPPAYRLLEWYMRLFH